jgi:Protein of unknown function (DUF1761)
MGDSNWLAVVVAGAITSLGLGFFWYGALFGKAWMAETGITRETKHRYSMPQMMGGSVIFSIVVAAALAHLIGDGGPMKGLHSGFFAGLLIGGSAIGTSYLWESKSIRHWLINTGYTSVHYALIGLILGLWH